MSADEAPRSRGPFGPMEALDDVQRQAFEAALRVTAELADLGGGLAEVTWLRPPTVGVDADGAVDGQRPLDVGRLRSDVAKAADTFTDLLRALLDVGFDAVDELTRRPATRPVGTAAPGSVAVVACTIRNGPEAAGDLRAHVPQLATVDGVVLASEATVAPGACDLGPHERIELRVSVAVPADAVPGRYHGLLLVRGLPDAAHAITIDVRDRIDADDRD